MKDDQNFIDEVTISVHAGNGGDGAATFRRERFAPRGGPSGGDGGRGGNVVLVGDRNLSTLLDYHYRRDVKAGHGEPGSSRNKDGRDGAIAEIRVPLGTLVFDDDAGDQALGDFTRDGEGLVVARGGRGGRGNAQFATATRQAPDFAERGQPGGERRLRLSLKLLADVGLVGLPNAGKSTLLRRISAARPRVAEYPFTTLIPHLGVAEIDGRRMVVADVPGLIEGASDGAGLGDRFLRHVERTRVLVHLVDASVFLWEDRDALADYETIRKELGSYDEGLLERREIVALNKVDLVADRGELSRLKSVLERPDRPVFETSGATGEGVTALLRAMAIALDETADDEVTS